MDVIPFGDDYEAAATLSDQPVDDLVRKDRERRVPWKRWLAVDGHPVAMSTAILRPDDKWFVSFAGEVDVACAALAETAANEVGSLRATVAAESPALVAMQEAGFETEVVNEDFRVLFSDALPRLRRAWLPTGCKIIGATDADGDRLFALDNELRGSVRGVEGWRGDRSLFEGELSDPGAYAVAEENGSYVGLGRIWHNRDEPRFGLLAVVPERRGSTIAGALLSHILTEASRWGFDSFNAATSVTNTPVHSHLARVGSSIGMQLQMVRA